MGGKIKMSERTNLLMEQEHSQNDIINDLDRRNRNWQKVNQIDGKIDQEIINRGAEIEDTITQLEQDSTAKASQALADAKAHTDTEVSSAKIHLKEDTDTKIGVALTAAEATAQDISEGHLTEAKEYTDTSSSNTKDAADTTAQEKVDAGLIVAADDATVKADTAKSEAISTAAADATTKADDALVAAKGYTDEEIETLTGISEEDATTKADKALADGRVYTDTKVSALEDTKGKAGGIAELDEDGHVPAAQLPSYVDDVLEFTNLAGFPDPGDAGKIYVSKDNNLTYRWSGTAYVEISASLALGETSGTAYRGDRGKTAYDHSQATHAPVNAQKNSLITKGEIEAKLTGVIGTHSHTVSKGDVGLGNVDNTSDKNKPISSAAQTAINLKADKTYVDNKVKTDVPAGAIFTDTTLVKSVNAKQGAVVLTAADIEMETGTTIAADSAAIKASVATKADKAATSAELTRLEADKADLLLLNQKVKTDVPLNAKFTDTIYKPGDNITISSENVIHALGQTGPVGPEGERGPSGIISNTTVETTLPGTEADIVLSGSPSNRNIHFKIPRGDKGERGLKGDKGETGSLDSLSSSHIEDALGYIPPKPYIAGENISIVEDKISVVGQLGLTEEEVKLVKVNSAKDADTVNGKTVGVNVPTGAKFTDTITTINGKTGTIAKADIVALGILAQGTELQLGNFKLVFNEVENSLDVEVLA